MNVMIVNFIAAAILFLAQKAVWLKNHKQKMPLKVKQAVHSKTF
jgi:hypothetical protein